LSARDPYAVLGVPYNATVRQIRKARRKLLLKYHPDLNPDDIEGAKARTVEILEAAAILEDPERRRACDQALGAFRREHGRVRPEESAPGAPPKEAKKKEPIVCPHCGYKNYRLANYGRCMLCGTFLLARPPSMGGIGPEPSFVPPFPTSKPFPRKPFMVISAVYVYFLGVTAFIRYGSVYLAVRRVYGELHLADRRPPMSLEQFQKTYAYFDSWHLQVDSAAMVIGLYAGAPLLFLGLLAVSYYVYKSFFLDGKGG
jgi:hypothetical protein